MIDRLHRDERGAQYVEMIALVLLIALACLGAWRLFGGELVSVTGDGERSVRTMQGGPGGRPTAPPPAERPVRREPIVYVAEPGTAPRDGERPVRREPIVYVAEPGTAPRREASTTAPPRPRFVPPPEWSQPYEEPFLGVDWDTFWSESWRRTKNLAAGDFNESQDGADITAQVFLGLTPAGVVADVRDVSGNIYGVWKGRPGAWIGLGAATVGIIPGVGDALKPLIKGGRRLVTEGVEAGVDAARRGGREAAEEAVDPLIAAARRNADEAVRLGREAPLQDALVQRLPGWEGRPNAAFGRLMADATRQLEGAIASGQVRTASEAIDFMAPRVRNVGETLGRTDAALDDLGRLRVGDDPLFTPMGEGGRYAGYRPAADQFLDGQYARQAVQDGVPMTLTVRNLGWQHTDPSSFPAIRARMDDAFQRALNAPTDADAVRAVADLHYWGAHMTPYRRGSAGGIDAITKAVLRRRNIPVGRWREGVGVDLEAFTLSREEFIRRYPTFFE